MVKVNYKQAREFLERIDSKDNIAICTHIDLDGFASGILLRDYVSKKGAKSEVRLVSYGISQILDKPLTEASKLLITDLAPGMIREDLNQLKSKEILYTDHHQEDKEKPIPDYVLELRTTGQGYIPSTRTIYELLPNECEGKFWLVTIGVLSDMAEKYPENTEFLKNAYHKLGLSYEEMLRYLFKFNFALIGAPSLEEAFEDISKMRSLDDIVKLAKYYEPVEREMERIQEDYFQNRQEIKNIVYYNVKTKYKGLKSTFINKVSGDEREKVLVFSVGLGEKLVSLSARNQSKEYDMVKFLQGCVQGFEGSEAGGHKSAAGAQLRKEDLEKFKERLKQINLEDYKI